MTNFTTRMMIAAATLVVAAGTASAQRLKAEIPFTFRAGGKVLEAGTYQVTVEQKAGGPVYRFVSESDDRSVFVLAGASVDPKQAWVASGHGVMTFECGTGHCALSSIWPGGETRAYAIPRPRLGRDEPTRTAQVAMRPDKGE